MTGSDTATTTTTTLNLKIDPSVPENEVHNTNVLARARNLTAPMFGACAGILGLTSYTGFAFYGVTALAMWAVTLGVGTMRSGSGGSGGGRERGDGVGRYVESVSSSVTGALVGGLPSYMLFWTLFYGLVYVYD